MHPSETGKRYDAIASWWKTQEVTSTTGLRYVARAVGLTLQRGKALDVGCGSGGRIVDVLTTAGFRVTGIDVSERMLDAAKQRHAHATFVHADICTWEPDDHYDLIVAWDSTFHLPQSQQRPVLQKLCRALAAGGAIVFTAGGIDGEITGEMAGQTFYYSSLADGDYLTILNDAGLRCVLLEREQYPEEHMVVIAVRPHVIPNEAR